MKKHDDIIYLRHILEAMQQIAEYVHNTDLSSFRTDRMRQDAVIRQLEIIGEATKNVSQEIRDTYPQVPWKNMAGMRDVLIHNYFGVDIAAVWSTAVQDLPNLRREISRMIPAEP
ncbi:MAG: DUF86 domain-containing protein [Desulfuromonas sp.]